MKEPDYNTPEWPNWAKAHIRELEAQVATLSSVKKGREPYLRKESGMAFKIKQEIACDVANERYTIDHAAIEKITAKIGCIYAGILRKHYEYRDYENRCKNIDAVYMVMGGPMPGVISTRELYDYTYTLLGAWKWKV